MKFGIQLLSKSVPEWKSHNISYNDIKLLIRNATDQRRSGPDSAEKLHSAFIEEIDRVNLFINVKLGELKRRFLYAEDIVDKIESHHIDTDVTDSPEYARLYQNLDVISGDLQKLSRFIVIQKTAIRKLLKKYTKYSQDGGELNISINKYMIQNDESFIHVDLTGFYLELALIYDLIRAKQSPPTVQLTSSHQARARRASYADPVQSLSIDEKFDFENIRNSTQKQHFLVHYDNLAELKIFLLSNFYFVDESTSHERKNLQLQRQQSSISFRKLIERRSSVDDLNKKAEERKKRDDEEGLEGMDERSKDIYRSNSIYLSEADQLTNNGDVCVVYLDSRRNMMSTNPDTDPGMLLTDLTKNDRSLLVASIGGLRKAANALLQNREFFINNLLDACLNGVTFDSFYSQYEEVINSLDSLEKISIEWLFTRHTEPVLKMSCNKTRFTSNITNDKAQVQSWITLSSNIKFSTEDITSPTWTSVDDSSSTAFPYAVLEVRYKCPSATMTLPTELTKLTTSHLIHNIERSFNPVTYHLFTSHRLDFTPKWAEFFGPNATDIRKTPPRAPRRAKSSLNTKRAESTVSLSAVSESSGDKQHTSASESQFRYWNEFDNGSEGGDDAGFFVDVDDDDAMFGAQSMEYFFKIGNALSAYMSEKVPFLFSVDHHHGNEGLVENEAYSAYGSVSEQSDLESVESLKGQRYDHDRFRVFLAVASSVISLFLVSLALGATWSLMSLGDVSVNPIVILILVLTYFASVSLSVVSIGFLMAVSELYRSVWHIGFVWLSFFAVMLLTVLGTITLFGL